MNTNSQENRRKIVFIKKQFQLNFIMKFCLVVLASTLIFGGLMFLVSKDSTTIIFKNLRIQTVPTQEFLLPSLTYGFIVSLIIASILTIIISMMASHRIGGPMFRFESVLKKLSDGDLTQTVVLREYDQCQDIARSLSLALNSLQVKVKNIDKEVKSLEEEFRKSGKPSENLIKIRQAVSEFKY